MLLLGECPVVLTFSRRGVITLVGVWAVDSRVGVGVGSGVRELAGVSVGAAVGAGAGVPVSARASIGTTVSGAGVVPEQAARDTRMTSTGVRRTFSTRITGPSSLFIRGIDDYILALLFCRGSRNLARHLHLSRHASSH